MQQASKMASIIPFGQPIHVGHHSEGRDRRYRAKIGRTIDRALEQRKAAQDAEDKLRGAEHNHAISSDDDDAIELLERKIAGMEEYQERMKAANKVVKSKKMTFEEKEAWMAENGYGPEVLHPPHWAGQGFANYQLSNNSANIRTAKKRLEGLKKAREVAAKLEAETGRASEEREYPHLGLRVYVNWEDNRLQLFFNGKPPENVRNILKSYGFKWAPSIGAWQRMIGSNLSLVSYKLPTIIKQLEGLNE
jgi:hypothetical protein